MAYTHPKWKLYTVIMGFTKHEIKQTPVPPNAGNKMQSFVGMLNCISWGVGLLKEKQKKLRIFLT